MNKLKGIYHTLLFMWIGRFGGSIDGGGYYLLKTIRVHKEADISLSNLTINKLHSGSVFCVDAGALANAKLDDITMNDTGWIFTNDE